MARTEPKILLLSYFGEGWTSGGAVIVDALLRGYSKESVVRFHVALRGKENQNTLAQVTKTALHVPGVFTPGIRASVGSRALFYGGAAIQARQAQQFADQEDVDVAWSILDFAWVPTTYHFMRRTRLPVHVSVHDDPVTSAKLWGWPASLLRRLEDHFAFCYASAVSRDVISDGMRLYYKRRYGVDAVVITHGVTVSDSASSEAVISSPTTSLKGQVRIAHAGNMHYPEEATVFARALEEMPGNHWRFEHFGGPQPWMAPFEGKVAAQRGWTPLQELERQLGEYDFAYLPYGFSQDRRLFVETSFPTKLITYVKCGLPILYHGPAYSSVARFLDTYRAGIVIDSQNPAKIRDILRSISEDDRASMRRECRRAVLEQFDQQRINSRWREKMFSAVSS